MLSNWTRRFERYRELQRKIEQKLDYNDDRGDKDRGTGNNDMENSATDNNSNYTTWLE